MNTKNIYRAIDHQRAIRLIKKAKSVAIACHIHPDGDCLGSEIALGGKVARLFNGGGHYDIAGCYIPNTPKAKKLLLKEVKTVVRKG